MTARIILTTENYIGSKGEPGVYFKIQIRLKFLWFIPFWQDLADGNGAEAVIWYFKTAKEAEDALSFAIKNLKIKIVKNYD